MCFATLRAQSAPVYRLQYPRHNTPTTKNSPRHAEWCLSRASLLLSHAVIICMFGSGPKKTGSVSFGSVQNL